MSPTLTLPSDRPAILVVGGLLAGLPPEAIYAYLLVRVIVPLLLLAVAIRSATTTQRIALIQAYLLAPAAQVDRGRRLKHDPRG